MTAYCTLGIEGVGRRREEEGGWPVAMCEALNLMALGPKKQRAELCLSNFPHSSLGTAQFRWGLSLRDRGAAAVSSSSLESAHMQTSRSSSPQHCD